MSGGSQYYTLVASLPELTSGMGFRECNVPVTGPASGAEAIYGEIRRELSSGDRRAAGLLWSLCDIFGMRRERIEQLYSMCAASPCGWLRAWAQFDRNVRNIVAAQTSRAKGFPVADSLLSIEGDEVPLSLAKSTAADFSLRGELDYLDRLLTASGDTASMVEKERTIDTIRWEKAESLAEEDSFGAPTLLSYLVKVAITGRWERLDPTVGREMYEKLVTSLEIPNL